MATQRTFTAEEAQKKFESLPNEIKSLLYTPEVTSTIQKIGEKNHLHFDQMGMLEIEASNVMLGFTEPQDLPQIIANSLRIDQTQANAVIQDLNELLFAKIRNTMKTGAATISKPTTSAGEKSVVMPSKAVSMGAEIKPVLPATPSVPTQTAKPPVATMPTQASKPVVPMTSTPAPAKPPVPVAVQPKPAASAVAAPVIPISTPSIPAPATPTPAAAPAQKPQSDTTKADTMLSKPTVSLPAQPSTPALPKSPTPPAPAKIDPAKPTSYKSDPYREPVE